MKLFGIILAAFKLTIFLMFCALVFIVQIPVLLITRGPKSYILPQLWHKAVGFVMGLKIEVDGTPHQDSQTLFVSNHMSYLDIITLGGLIRASFVSKAEVKNWPLIGQLCGLQQTAFIHRKRDEALKHKDSLLSMIADGKSLIVFPEGTTTDGQSVYPFKSSLFSLALENKERLVIQPISLVLLSADGSPPIAQDIRDIYSWHINLDMSFGLHLWLFAKTSGATLKVIFHDPITPSDYEDRKTLAKTCEDIVSKGHQKYYNKG